MRLLRQFLKHPQLLKATAASYNFETKSFGKAGDMLQEVNDLVRKAHLFVIEDPTTTVPTPQLTAPQELPLAPPFPICWFEPYAPNDKLPVIYIQDEALGMMVAPVGVLMHELRPGFYDLFVLEMLGGAPETVADFAIKMLRLHRAKRDLPWIEELDVMGKVSGKNRDQMLRSARDEIVKFCAQKGIHAVKEEHNPTHMLETFSSSVTVYRNVDSHVDVKDSASIPLMIAGRWLRMVNEGILAVEETKDVLHIPRPDRPHKKKPFEIRRIVRILPKRKYKKAEPITQHGVIDWSHRWEVRGHWRDIKGVGKDRAGNYVVHGHTWVKDFVKGPEDKPLIVKNRVLMTGVTPELEPSHEQQN